MSTRRRLTEDESKKLAAAQKRLKLAKEKLAESVERGTTSTEERLRRTIKRAQQEIDEVNESIDARIAARKEDYSEELLARVKEEFPLIGTGSATDWGRVLSGEPSVDDAPEESHSFTIEELMQELERSRTRLLSMGTDENSSGARKYLLQRIDGIKVMLHDLREEEAEAKRQEKAESDNRDFLAAEADIAPLRDKLNSRLSAGFLPLDIREKTRQTFLELAVKNQERAKEAGNTLQDGIHPRAIFEERRDWYQKSANQLKIFEYDLNQNAPIHTLDGFDKMYWDSGQIIGAANLNFRTKIEKALIVYCARKYFEGTGNRVLLAQLPDWPDASQYIVPKAPPISLENLLQAEMEKCLSALEPLHFDSIGEVIYSVPTNSVERPNSKPLLLWGTGAEVKVGVEVLYDKRASGYRKFPTPAALEPDWATGGQRYEWEQDAMRGGEWVKVPISNAPREGWFQDTEGNWKRESSFNGQWVRSALIKVVPGDRKPPEDDPRTEFRYSHWFTPEEVQRADQAQMNMRLLTMPSQRTIADQVATERTSPLSEAESCNTWRRWESQQKLNEGKHV